MHTPVIKKASIITGNSINLRNAQEDDAAFILSIRVDEKKSRFISSTTPDLNVQRQWLEQYNKDDKQAYFIITDKHNKPFGTVRMYDAQEDSFCWGSWVLSDIAPSHFAIESALIIYSYAIELGFKSAHFDVRKGNHSVIKFHQRFGAVQTHESEMDVFLKIDEQAINASLNKYRKYLPKGINIIEA